MLIRLLPEQAADQWDVIAPMIEASLPTITQPNATVMVNILESIMLDRAIVWLLEGEEGPAKGLMLTTDWVDPICHYHHVFIYAVYGITDLSIVELRSAVESIRTYALGIGAEGVIAYTSNVQIARLVRRLGGRADHILLEL
jgi:hypothetical protein